MDAGTAGFLGSARPPVPASPNHPARLWEKIGELTMEKDFWPRHLVAVSDASRRGNTRGAESIRLAAVARAKLPPRNTVSDSILAPGGRTEELSWAYVQAVAAAAGYVLAEQDDTQSPWKTQSVR